MTVDSAPSVWRFGLFELDLRSGQLTKSGATVRLPAQPCQILCALLKTPGQVVTREELRQLVWPNGTFVDFEVGLNAAIRRLRHALGDSAENPRFIETVHRQGYRFIAPVKGIHANQAEDSTASAHIPSPPSRQTRWRARITIAAALLALVITSAWLISRSRRVPVVAVLPLKNLSSQPNTDYFSDGLTDEIIRNLSLIEGLEVKSRGSSFELKDKTLSPHEAGKRLGAELILEGSVLREGDKLRVNVELVRAADDKTIWSARYHRELKDVFAIQNEIALSIVNELRLRNVGQRRRYNTDIETYDIYLRAEALAKEGALGIEAMAGAIDLYKRAIQNDPNFAPAYAGLAHCYGRMRVRGQYEEPTRLMRSAAQRAMELDPLLPEANAMLGLVYASDLDWNRAEASFRRAIELNPNMSYVREDYALYLLLPEGKIEEAVHQSRRAVELDPLNMARKVMLSFVLLESGAYEEARKLAGDVYLSNPSSLFAGQNYCRALLLQGHSEEAIKILQTLGPQSLAVLGYAYAKVGRRNDAEAIAASDDPAILRHRVLIYSGLGDSDRTMQALKDDSAVHDGLVDVYPSYPELAWLRDDPRMKSFRQSRGLH